MIEQPGRNGGKLSSWSKGESGNLNGRPPKLFSALAREWKERGIEKATPAAVQEVYEYLLALPLREVIEIAGQPLNDLKTNDYPAIMRIAAAEMIGKRKREILDSMLDRAHGKSMQRTETKETVDLNFTWNVVKTYDAPDNDTDEETNVGARPVGR